MIDLQLFAQLEAWREKGYQPELLGAKDGWVVRLDTEKFSHPTMDIRCSLRMSTEICDTPQAAIEAALKVVQP